MAFDVKIQNNLRVINFVFLNCLVQHFILGHAKANIDMSFQINNKVGGQSIL